MTAINSTSGKFRYKQNMCTFAQMYVQKCVYVFVDESQKLV